MQRFGRGWRGRGRFGCRSGRVRGPGPVRDLRRLLGGVQVGVLEGIDLHEARHRRVGRELPRRLADGGRHPPRSQERIRPVGPVRGQLHHARQPHRLARADPRPRLFRLAPQPLPAHSAQRRKADDRHRLHQRAPLHPGRRLFLRRVVTLQLEDLGLRHLLDQRGRRTRGVERQGLCLLLRRRRIGEPLLQRRLQHPLLRFERAQDPVGQEPSHHHQRAQVVDGREVDGLAQGAAPVEAADHAVDLVRQVGEQVGEARIVHREERGHRQIACGQLFRPPHRLDQRGLGAALEARVALDHLRLDAEAAALPGHQPEEGGLAEERTQLGIHHLAVAHPQPRVTAIRLAAHQRAGLCRRERLERVDQPEVAHRSADEIRRRALPELARLQQGLRATHQLPEQDGLAQELVGAGLERARRQRRVRAGDDDRQRRVRRANLPAHRDAILRGQGGLADQQIGRRRQHALQRLGSIRHRRDRKARLAQCQLEDAQAARVGVGDEQAGLRHGASFKFCACRRGGPRARRPPSSPACRGAAR